MGWVGAETRSPALPSKLSAGILEDQETGYEPVGVQPIREFESPPALHDFASIENFSRKCLQSAGD